MKQLGLRDLFWDNYSYSWIKDIENYLDEDLDDELNTIIYIKFNIICVFSFIFIHVLFEVILL